jgi:hypothetical protein
VIHTATARTALTAHNALHKKLIRYINQNHGVNFLTRRSQRIRLGDRTRITVQKITIHLGSKTLRYNPVDEFIRNKLTR